MKARLGGALSRVKEAREAYPRIAWINIDLPSGEELMLFYNDEKRLFVGDMIGKGEIHLEFVRIHIPESQE